MLDYVRSQRRKFWRKKTCLAPPLVPPQVGDSSPLPIPKISSASVTATHSILLSCQSIASPKGPRPATPSQHLRIVRFLRELACRLLIMWTCLPLASDRDWGLGDGTGREDFVVRATMKHGMLIQWHLLLYSIRDIFLVLLRFICSLRSRLSMFTSQRRYTRWRLVQLADPGVY